jgi:hypothetical protein
MDKIIKTAQKIVNVVRNISQQALAVQYSIIQCNSMMHKFRVYFNIAGKLSTLSHLIKYVNCKVPSSDGKSKVDFIDNIFDKSST